MNMQDVKILLDLFDQSTAQGMKLSDGDFSLELQRGGTTPIQTVEKPVVSSAVAVNIPQGETVNAPLIGTYYAAPSPDSAPFVAVGQQVKKGETICLIEAMKMMSEVPAPCDCVVEELLQENGALLAFDAPILRYRTV